MWSHLVLLVLFLHSSCCAEFNKSCSSLNIIYKSFKEDEIFDVSQYGHDMYIEASSGVIHSDTFTDIPNISKFMVFNSNFTSFDFTALYKMTYLESVDMMEVTGLPVLTNVVMLGLKNLSRLSIYHTDIKFDYNTFQNLKRLKYLSISKVDVAILGENKQMRFFDIFTQKVVLTGNEVFNGSMLEELYWTDSGIEKIDRYCFSPLGNIKIINLRGNKLAYLWPETFIGLKRLERLYLNRNQLATINFRNLEHLQSLKYLDISMNKFPTIRIEEVSKSSPNLTTIVLDKKSVEKDHIANSNSRLRIVFV